MPKQEFLPIMGYEPKSQRSQSVKNIAFQVKERGAWRDVPDDVDIVLKRSFLAGFPSAGYSEAGRKYEADFVRLVRRSLCTGAECDLRVPFGWSAPRVKKASSTRAYAAAPRATAEAPAKLTLGDALARMDAEEERKPQQEEKTKSAKGAEWSTGQKVAAGLAGGAVLAAGAFAGGVATSGEVSGDGAVEAFEDLGRPVAEAAQQAGDDIADFADRAGEEIADGWDQAVKDLGTNDADVAADIGEGVADAGQAVGDGVADAAQSVVACVCELELV